jgi:hypothetical protein
MDRKAMNPAEVEARQELVSLATAMLNGTMSYFEGAAKVLQIKGLVGGATDRDKDFDAFVVIGSETDHLPLAQQRRLWSKEALKKLEPEFIKTEEWASEFAPRACKNIIARFGGS